MDLESFHELGNDLYHRLHLPTYPVAIKFIKKEDEIPKEAIRPSAGGQKWSLCQAFTYARRMGLHLAMTDDDNFCVPSSASMGWVDVPVEELFESQIQQGWHKDRAAEQCRFDFVAQTLYSGTTVSEMAVGIPGPDVARVNDELFKSGGHQNMGYPLKGLLATGLTESITPGFKYLRDVMDKQKNK